MDPLATWAIGILLAVVGWIGANIWAELKELRRENTSLRVDVADLRATLSAQREEIHRMAARLETMNAT